MGSVTYYLRVRGVPTGPKRHNRPCLAVMVRLDTWYNRRSYCFEGYQTRVSMNAIPKPVNAEDELTDPMHMIDHTCARQDGPPEMPENNATQIKTNNKKRNLYHIRKR